MEHQIKKPQKAEDVLNWSELRPGHGHVRNAHQQLMHELTSMCFDRLAARFDCKRLEHHRARLKQKPGRDPGIQVADKIDLSRFSESTSETVTISDHGEDG